ncbi:Arm DNA-binding domain-containing protein [Chitinophagaceae bacterium LB-8]|uniref:Arm DNA-binding domain-containing protein n=1 Tax=Paraflavisolibacter caeni TaxID=2982496 RepID=A0A9X2XW81_9BACT|nr:Arm DNA-binding domain-containing protein [Paraflavisolibacter caeni]MCU7550200.1 Arm DNA-binding domain-containing protein [Paraflavisolibacter caeni]
MNRKHTFSLLPFVREHKKNKEGQIPVYLRITVDGKRSELSTKTYVDPGKRNEGKGRVKGTNEESRRLNNAIEAFRGS